MAWSTPFSKKEDQFIRKSYPKMKVCDIAKHLGRSRQGVSRRIGVLGLRKETSTTRARMGDASLATHKTSEKPPKGLREVARLGDEQKTLEELRDVLAARLMETESARDTAALSKRMIEVGRRITELQRAKNAGNKAPDVEVTRFDVIAGRNAERRKAAQA